MAEKKRFFANHSKSSALMVSLAIHGVLIAAAIVIVAFKIAKPHEDPDFGEVSVKPNEAPQKKPQIPGATRTLTPPPTSPITPISSDRSPNFSSVNLPGISIQPGVITDSGEVNLTDLINSDIFPPWGDDESLGNELCGTFYDLKQTDKGEPVEMNINRFFSTLAHFANGWNLGRLDDYFQAPKRKYTTLFMIPTINSSEAAKAFGVAEVVEPNFWAAYYVGKIAAPETGYYRFHGYGDDILLVRINNRLVIDAGFAGYRSKLETGWESDDDNDRKFPIGKQLLYIGDWFKLSKGEAVKMEVLIGDVGGLCSSQLLIEQRGVEYRQVPFESGTRPVLPIFKTRDIPADLQSQLPVDPSEATVNGPSFSVITK